VNILDGEGGSSMFYFIPEKDLRGIILEILKDQEKSISKITKDLKDKGHEYHRLMITGYLKALADLGLLKEKAIPPSKVYAIPPNKSKNMYELIGQLAKARNLGFRKESLLCAQVLETLFRRPIFLSEVNMCGYEEPPNIKKVSGDERSDARAIVSKVGLKIGSRDMAFTCKTPFMEDVVDIIAELALEMSGTKGLRKGTKQTTLDL
jgi:DNA-binding PadR family transcriptional regulator